MTPVAGGAAFYPRRLLRVPLDKSDGEKGGKVHVHPAVHSAFNSPWP